ncbi:Prefoldin subunit-domain-containing protein [Morchella snyderi]|nr:Prefoldin subunit-domain-containing protein [Morchella snyderi]
MSSSLRPRLERLRKSLRHWQIYSNEYEALRRELSSLPLAATREDMLELALKATRKVVDEQEVEDLLGDGLQTKRNVIEVITEITHRLDDATENVDQLEEQIEAAENEIDPDEEDEEDEYEPVDDAKYRPTAEGLATPEVQKELEEFRKRLHERGEAARAEAAKVAAEDEEKSIKKRRGGGVRFAQETDGEESGEEDTSITKDSAGANVGSSKKTDTVDTLESIRSDPVDKKDPVENEDPLDKADSIDKPQSVLKSGAVDKQASAGDCPSFSRKHASDTEDEYSVSESSAAEGERQPPKRVMLTTVTRSITCSNPPDSSTQD